MPLNDEQLGCTCADTPCSNRKSSSCSSWTLEVDVTLRPNDMPRGRAFDGIVGNDDDVGRQHDDAATGISSRIASFAAREA